ncbi:hypothetical protein SKAU_G00429200 [Synaphobranchus kaupii]|uniref:Uncharacterized protein n=1 Tax=Synaphobranchus kaupii TaxID=118154 RepID=A0A9Q1E4X1_SYNKA|nr:hypothetical protein SKAU_G00429200 [Synaphobranchus kaupii]
MDTESTYSGYSYYSGRSRGSHRHGGITTADRFRKGEGRRSEVVVATGLPFAKRRGEECGRAQTLQMCPPANHERALTHRAG